MVLLAFPIQDLGVIIAFLCCLYIASCNIVIPGLMFAALCTTYLLFRTWREAKQVHPFDKYVLITGCDTGFGNRFARLLDRKGFHVFATCYSDTSDGAIDLKETGSHRMRVLQLDVSSQDSVDACVLRVKQICGEKGLWAVVNNAGIQLNIDTELLDMEAYHRICEVNLFGTVRVCKGFLPLVRKQKENRQRSLKKLVANASDEVKQAYGEKYLARFTNSPIKRTPPCVDEKIRGVLESLESAVCSLHPRIRYLTGSTNLWVDTFLLLARLRRFLPASVMDLVLIWDSIGQNKNSLNRNQGPIDKSNLSLS